VIKYIGSKRVLVPAILEIVNSLPGVATVLDLFSGTGRVGHALKAAGYRVVANDHNAYAAALARCYVAADREDVLADAERLVAEFNALPGRPGWFTETYCLQSRFFQPKNGGRIDAIREAIEAKGLPPDLEAVLLVSLMEAADRVDSTTGVQMAYLKQWAPRSYNDLELRLPALLPGTGTATRRDANELVREPDGEVKVVFKMLTRASAFAKTRIVPRALPVFIYWIANAADVLQALTTPTLAAPYSLLAEAVLRASGALEGLEL